MGTRILFKTLESRHIGMKGLPKLSTFIFAATTELERALSWIVTWSTQNLKNVSALAHQEESAPDNAEVKEILFLLKIFQKKTKKFKTVSNSNQRKSDIKSDIFRVKVLPSYYKKAYQNK